MNRLRSVVFATTAAFLAFGTAPATAVPIVNSSFETGDFTGWTQTGNTTFNGVQCPGPGPAVVEGNCSAFFGPIGSLGGISQDIPTVPGQSYEISFWVDPDGGAPSQLVLSFGGTTLINSVNLADAPYTLFTAIGIGGAGATTALSFSFRDDPGFIYLDAISVVEAPEPMTLALFGAGLAGLAVIRRRRRAKA